MDRLPNMADFNRQRVTNPNQSEVIRQRLFDFQLYPAAGVTSLNFFSLPIGQGQGTAPVTAAGTPKSKSDTNLTNANTLPSGKEFKIESIEVVFLPGSVSTANTFTPAYPIFTGVTEGTIEALFARDLYAIYNSGLLELNILDKNYLSEPLLKSFPPKTVWELQASVATATASADLVAANAVVTGRPYYIEPTISLQPAVNFGVVLSWPGAVATPSTFNGRIGVILDGYVLRASQ